MPSVGSVPDCNAGIVAASSPTSTTIQIGGLAQPEAMVEIEMIAGIE